MIKNCFYCKKEFKARYIKRKYCNQKCYSESRIGQKRNYSLAGSNNPNWKGGRRKDKDGYVLIYAPDHPYCDVNSYVREHRLVMEKHLKRFLLSTEIPHHINENKEDNRIENLQLMTRQEHDKFRGVK